MWIEILTFLSSVLFLVVEARESLVDRNYCDTGAEYSVNVEARESLVDRNNLIFNLHFAGERRGSREPCGSKSIRIAGLADR